MAKYQNLGGNLYGLDTEIGRAVIRSDEETLRRAGHEPDDTAGFDAAYAAQQGKDDTAGFDAAYEREMENPTPERPLEAPYVRPDMRDPGRLSQAFGGAEAKAPRGFNSQQAVADAEMAKAGYAQPTAPVGTDALPPAQPGDKFSSAPVVAEQQRQWREGVGPRPGPPGQPGGKGLVYASQPGAPPGQPAEEGEPVSPAVLQAMEEASRGGGGYSPGGMQLSSRTVKGRQIPEGAVRATLDAPDSLAGPARAVTVAEARGNLGQANQIAGWAQEETDRIAAEEAHRANVIDPEIQRRQNEATRRWQAAENLSKPDVERAWRNKSTLGKILATVFLVFSRIASAKTGVSVADQVFDKERDDDIAAQKEEYERAAAKGQRASNEYAEAMKLYGTPEMAERDMRLRKNMVFEAMVKQQALRSQNPETIARTELWLAERKAARQADMAKFLADVAPQVEEQWKYRPPSGGGGGGGILKQYRAGAELKGYEDKILGRDRPRGVGDQRAVEFGMKTRINNLPGGRTGYAPPDEARAVRKMMAQKAALDDGIKRVAALRAEMAAGKLGKLQYVSRLRTISSQLAVAFKEQSGLGAWDNGVARLWEGVTGLPGGGGEKSMWNAYGALPSPGELVGIAQSGGRLDEFQRAGNSLQEQTLRQVVSADPEGKIPFYGQVPEE